MAQTSRYQYETFDPTVDGAKKFKEFVEKDSKANMEKLDVDLGRIEDKVDNKNKLNNENKENFNFIGNKVTSNIADAWNFNSNIGINGGTLVIPSGWTLGGGSISNQINSTADIDISSFVSSMSNFHIVFVGFPTSTSGIVTIGESASTRKAVRILYNGSVFVNETSVGTFNGTMFSRHLFEIVCVGGFACLLIDGQKFDIGNVSTETKRIALLRDRNNVGAFIGIACDLQISNNKLTPTEIAHNLSVLNNSTSVKSLETTDATGKKINLLLGSDTDHVETRTGHTIEESNAELLKAMSKEFVSNGADITVSNGIGKQRVLGAEIQGQTVKNLLTYGNWLVTNTAGTPVTGYAEWDNKTFDITIKANNTTAWNIIRKAISVEANKTYYIVAERAFGVLVGYPAFSEGILVEKISNSVYKFTATRTGDLGIKLAMADGATAPYLLGKLYVFEGVNPALDFSTYIQPNTLTSTVATISNNGQSYPLCYLDEIGQKKQILCRGVGGVNDTVKMNSDGSLVVQEKTSSLINQVSKMSDSTLCYRFTLSLTGINGNPSVIVTSTYPTKTWNEVVAGGWDSEFIVNDTAGKIIITVKKDKLASGTVEDLKKLLADTSFDVVYQLATPTTYTVDKSVNEAIATDKMNILRVESPVAPSSFSVTLPCTDGIKKEFTPTLLNGYTQTTGSISPRLALRQDGRVEISMDLLSPATFNATVLSLPVELRPSKDIKVTGFVDNIATPIIIKATGEVQLPNSVVSKNVWLKDYYRLGVM